jgi:uncharacterized protein (TIGR02001 family)
MKRVALSVALVAGLTGSAMAADMATKAPPAAPPPPSPWDVAITAALMTDYNFRGITQSAHNPSTQATFEPRYNFNSTWQGYVGLSGESIDFPNNAAAEIDFYGGIRPTFDKLALDFGAWYYWYPGGNCYGTTAAGNPGGCNGASAGPIVPSKNNPGPAGNGNFVVPNESFWEVYAKATYTINDQWSVEGQYYYSPNVSNSGASGNYITGNVTYTEPSSWYPASWGLGGYISGDAGYWDLGTSSAFYGIATGSVNALGVATPAFPNGIKYTSYWNWDAGFGFTYKAFTLDLRYYGTNLTSAECNAFTSASNSTFSPGNVTAQNPGGLGSNWCSAAYIAKLTFQTNLSGLK